MKVTLHQGDCLEFIKTLDPSSIDAVITDPPYGIEHSSGWDSSWQRTQIAGDKDTSLRDAVIDWAESHSVSWVMFGTWRMPRPESAKAILVWDKGPTSGMGDLSFPWKLSWEEVYVGGKAWSGHRDEGVLRGHSVTNFEKLGRRHPHQKPVSLMIEFVRKLPPDATIFDPFMGSGTTGVACVKSGRNFIGCEVDPKHFATAERRIEEAKPTLFGALS